MEIPNPSVKNRASNEIVYFGYPHQSKNLETLIGAMDLLPTYKLRFFSRFNKNDSYAMSLIDKMKSVNNIVIETDASDENIVTALAKSAFFVLPQDQPLTAKSSTAITAACCGSVVIAKASDNPKYQMPYINNVNCLLMEDVLPTSIANAIKNTSPKQVLELSNESLKLRSYFDWDNIVRSYGKLYK
jgi:glycosyltransferase involved in cell wall biosynthesis